MEELEVAFYDFLKIPKKKRTKQLTTAKIISLLPRNIAEMKTAFLKSAKYKRIQRLAAYKILLRHYRQICKDELDITNAPESEDFRNILSFLNIVIEQPLTPEVPQQSEIQDQKKPKRLKKRTKSKSKSAAEKLQEEAKEIASSCIDYFNDTIGETILSLIDITMANAKTSIDAIYNPLPEPEKPKKKTKRRVSLKTKRHVEVSKKPKRHTLDPDELKRTLAHNETNDSILVKENLPKKKTRKRKSLNRTGMREEPGHVNIEPVKRKIYSTLDVEPEKRPKRRKRSVVKSPRTRMIPNASFAPVSMTFSDWSESSSDDVPYNTLDSIDEEMRNVNVEELIKVAQVEQTTDGTTKPKTRKAKRKSEGRVKVPRKKKSLAVTML